MLTNFLQMKSYLHHTKSRHEYTSCKLKKITFIKTVVSWSWHI